MLRRYPSPTYRSARYLYARSRTGELHACSRSGLAVAITTPKAFSASHSLETQPIISRVGACHQADLLHFFCAAASNTVVAINVITDFIW